MAMTEEWRHIYGHSGILMKHINVSSIDDLKKHGISKAVVAIGVFDGLHLGHRHLLDELKKLSSRLEACPVVLTFHPHPREILKPNESLLLLISHEKKIELIHNFGIKAVVTFPFTREFASLPASDFLSSCLLSKAVKLCGICVGEKWRFGRGGGGDILTIGDFAGKHGIEFKAVEEFKIGGQVVSSSSIRRAVTGGLLDQAAKMLGRHYSLSGTVEHGENLATRALECPTANIAVSHGIIPPKGVYAGFAWLEGKSYPAAISIGTAPTFKYGNPLKILIEAHLFDFNSDAYGKKLEVELVKYVREERCFSSVEDLKKQIHDDLKEIRRILDRR